MANGKVKLFSNQKAYRFIPTDDGENIFVCFSTIQTLSI
jgi:cold shock CspA family protein